jgi:hypothetical protein
MATTTTKGVARAMTTSEFFDLAQRFADLGDAVGRQVLQCNEAVANGSETPISDTECNPNALSMWQTHDLLAGLVGEGVEGAEELFEAIDAELKSGVTF